MWRTQWTGCHGEKRHGCDRGCGGHNGQGVMMRRDMEVTEVVEAQLTGFHGEVRHGGDRGCGGHNGQGVMVRRDMELTEVVEDVMERVSW